MGDDERKLFVGKLPQDIHEDEIRMIFNTYGRTTDVHLMSQSQQQPGQDRCAFVTYETPEAAKVAMQVLNGVYKFREEATEPINVNIAFRRTKGGKGSDSKGGRDDRDDRRGKGGGFERGSDRGPPPAYDHRGSFDRGCDRGPDRGGYDRGLDRGMDRGGYDRPPVYDRGVERGYDRGGYDRGGFDRGCSGGKGKDRGGIDRGFDRGYDRGYDRAPPPRSYDRMPDRGPPRDMQSPRSDGNGKGSGKRNVGTKLYIGNLPADITREAIDMVFSTYGRVLDVHIMNARAKNGQSCAFVVYATSAEAKTCMSAMQQGYEIRPGEGNIYVKFADESKPGEKGRFTMERARPY